MSGHPSALIPSGRIMPMQCPGVGGYLGSTGVLRQSSGLLNAQDVMPRNAGRVGIMLDQCDYSDREGQGPLLFF